MSLSGDIDFFLALAVKKGFWPNLGSTVIVLPKPRFKNIMPAID